MKRAKFRKTWILSIAFLLLAPLLFAGHTQSPAQIKMGEIEGILSKYGAPNDEKTSSKETWDDTVNRLNYDSLTDLNSLPVKDIHDRMIELRNLLKNSSIKSPLADSELQVASRFLRAQTKFYLLFMKAAHAGAGEKPVAASLSLKPIDELNLQIELTSGLRLYQGHRYNSRHMDDQPTLIEFFVTEEQKRDAEQLSLPKPRSLNYSYEKKNPSTPLDELNYSQLITFSTLNNLTQNRWALLKLFSPAQVIAPTSCGQNYFFTLKNPNAVISDLSTSDWYKDVYANLLPLFFENSKNSLIENSDDFTFYFLKHYMTGVQGKNLKELQKNYGEDNSFKLVFEDFYGASDSFVKKLALNQTESWQAHGADILQSSSFEQDSFDPEKIAKRMANYHYAYLRKAAIEQSNAYINPKVKSQAMDNQSAADYLKIVESYLDQKKDAWIQSSHDTYLTVARAGLAKETIQGLSQSRINEMVNSTATEAAMAVPAYYEKSHLDEIKPAKLIGARFDGKFPFLKQTNIYGNQEDFSGTFKLTVSTPDLWQSFIHAKLMALEDQKVNFGEKGFADILGNQITAVKEMRLIQKAFTQNPSFSRTYPILSQIVKNPMPVLKIPGSATAARLQQIREALDNKQTQTKIFTEFVTTLRDLGAKQTADFTASLELAFLFNNVDDEYQTTKGLINSSNKDYFFAQIVYKHIQNLYTKYPNPYLLSVNTPGGAIPTPIQYDNTLKSDYLTSSRFSPKVFEPIQPKAKPQAYTLEEKTQPLAASALNMFIPNAVAAIDHTAIPIFKTEYDLKLPSPSPLSEDSVIPIDPNISNHVRSVLLNLGVSDFAMANKFSNRELTPTLYDHLLYSGTLLSFAYSKSPILKNEKEVKVGEKETTLQMGVYERDDITDFRPNVFRLLSTYNPRTSSDGSIDRNALEAQVRVFLSEANENDQKNLEDLCTVDISKRDTKTFKKLYQTASAIRDTLTQSESLKKVDADITKDITPWYETTTASYVFMGGLLVLAILTSLVDPLATPMLALFLSGINLTAAESMTMLNIKTQVIEPSNQFNFELRVASSYIIGNPDQRIAAVERVNADHKTLGLQTAITFLMLPLDGLNFKQAGGEFTKYIGTKSAFAYEKVSGSVARGFGETIDATKPFETFSTLRNEKGMYTAFRETAARVLSDGVKTAHYQFITEAEKDGLLVKAITDALPRDVSELTPVVGKRIEEISAQLTSEGTLSGIVDKIRRSITDPTSSPLFIMPKLFVKAVYNGNSAEFIKNYGATLNKLFKLQARSLNRELGALKQQQTVLTDLAVLNSEERTATEFAKRLKDKNVEITSLESLLKIKDKNLAPALITDLKTAFETRVDLKEIKPLLNDETPASVKEDLKNVASQLKHDARNQPETQADIAHFEKEVDGLTQ